MSLLTEAFESFTVINKVSASDGYGGINVTYADGAKIQGAMIFNSSSTIKIAEALGATGVYTFTVRRDILLDYHSIVRRESDQTIFRITTESDDNKTPMSASLDMRQYSAERWKLDE